MKTIEELLKNLARPEVLEFGLVTNRLPSVNIGGKFEPVDDEAPSNERLMAMLVTMGGGRYVDSLSDKPVQWTTKLEGVGVIAVAAILRKDIVQARFTVAKREAGAAPGAAAAARSAAAGAATTQPQTSKPAPPPAPKPTPQSARSIPSAAPAPAPAPKPVPPPAPSPASPARPASPGPASTPMTAAKATQQLTPQTIKSVGGSGAASSARTPAAAPVSATAQAAQPVPSPPAPAAAPAPPPLPVPPPPDDEWDDDDEPTLQTLSPPVAPPHMLPPDAPKAKPARRPDEVAAEERVAAEKAAAEKAAAEKEKAAAEKAAAEKAAAEKAAAEKAAAEKAAAEKAAAEKAAAEKAAAEKAAAEKAAAEKAAAEKAAAEKAAAERAAAEKAAAEKAAAEKAAAEKAAAEKAARERAEQERVARERAEQERVARERAEEERRAREAAENAAAEAAERDRLEREAAEKAAEEKAAAEARAAEARAADERAAEERAARERAAAQAAAQVTAQAAAQEAARLRAAQAKRGRISTPTSVDAVDVEITTTLPGSVKLPAAKKIDVDHDADGTEDTVSLPGGVDVAHAAQQSAAQARARGPVPTTTAPNIPEKDRPRVDAAAAIDSFLAMAVSAKATDLIIIAGRPVLLRVATDLMPRTQSVPAEQVERIAKDIVPARLRETLEKDGSCDFAVEHLTHGRFRVNVSRSRAGVKLTLRVIAKELPTLASLGLPEGIANGIRHESGLVLVTGPAGQGKSSTLAALVDLLNRETGKHVATIEEPIEHVHPRKKGLVSQRDVGLHTRTKAKAWASALRSDPDVVVASEIRDNETMRLALTAAEGGRLVLATMNAPSALIAIERVLRLFSPADHHWARLALAGSLRLVVGQHLIPSADRMKLHAAAELIPSSAALWSAIRAGRTQDFGGALAKTRGVVRLDDSLADLVRSQKVTIEVAKQYAEAPGDLEGNVARAKQGGQTGPGYR